jgi:hypothetical protein
MATARQAQDEHERFFRGIAAALILAAPVWAGVAYGLLVLVR